MKQPEFLRPGDAIATIAPSFGAATEPYLTRYEVSLKNLKKRGYRILEGKNVHREDGVVASAPAQERAEEFVEAYRSEAKAIFSVGGGELMNEILPYIDFKEIKKLPPKWFVGFSDNTHLTYTLTTQCGLITIYGSNFPAFFEKPLRLNQLDTIEMLEGKKEFAGYPKWNKPNFRKKKPLVPKPINPVKRFLYRTPKIITPVGYEKPIEGTLLGGCMDVILAMCGTKFDATGPFLLKHEEGIIWYLEACDLGPLQIRRGLFQLREAGYFRTAKAFLIGRPLCWDKDEMGVNRFNAVLDMLSDLNVPILLDVDLGHYSPSLPIKNGAKAIVSLKEGNLFIQYLE
ncbi:MAG: LD-carboxypeptidase [Bacilli bacterium]|nr:LD-carboxypeptidase [Bacilli bacterium]